MRKVRAWPSYKDGRVSANCLGATHMKNVFAISLAEVVFMVIPAMVMAQASAESEESIQTVCENQFPGHSAAVRLQQTLCMNALQINQLTSRIYELAANDQRTRTELEKQKKELLEAQAELAKARSSIRSSGTTDGPPGDARAWIAQQADALRRGVGATAPEPARPQRSSAGSAGNEADIQVTRFSPAPPPVVRPAPVPRTSVPYTVTPARGQYAATTFDVEGPRRWLYLLSHAADKWLPGATSVRIVAKKNGVMLPILNRDPAKSYNLIMADLNGDGKPDGTFSAVDPFEYEDIYISMVGPLDQVELIILTDTGLRVSIQGQPAQILWGDAKRVSYPKVQNTGRWATPSFGGNLRRT